MPENALYIGPLNEKLYQLLFRVMEQSSVVSDRHIFHRLAAQLRQKDYLEREIEGVNAGIIATSGR